MIGPLLRPLKHALDAMQRLDERLGVGLSPRGPWPIRWERRDGPSAVARWMSRHPIAAALAGYAVVAGFFLSAHALSGQLDTENALLDVGVALPASWPLYAAAQMLPHQIKSWEAWRAKRDPDKDVTGNDSN